MSVDKPVDNSGGSIPMDQLQQFVEEDTWYFSDEDSSGSPSDDEEDESTRGSDLGSDPESLFASEGHWVELCKSSTSTTNSATTNSFDQSSGLQSVVDFFLSKLEPYNAAYEEEETTDSGGNRASDTQLLLDPEDQQTSRSSLSETHAISDNPTLTSEQEATVHPTSEPVVQRTAEEKDHAKPVTLPLSTAKRPKCFFIANEILTSERTFVQGIRMLEKVLHGAVKTARDAGKPMIPESARKRIFLNISEIHALNSDLLEELENKLKLWDTKPVVCDAFASRAPYFKLYSIFASRYEDSQNAFTETLKKYKPFNELIRHIEDSNLCKGLPVTSYMLYPIQRIPRYKLLLQEYLKSLPVNHLDRSNTQEALKTISEVAQHLNDRIRDLEEQSTLVKLQKLFVGKETLVVPGRRFILRGPVELLSGKKLNKRKTRVLFLFSDVLLLTKISRNIKFKILKRFTLAEIQVSSMFSHSQENDFCVFLPSVPKPFRLCARNRKERDTWVTYLRKSVSLELERKKTFEDIKASHKFVYKDSNKRSPLSIFQDPSFEPRQPKCTRKTYHPRRRQLIVNPTSSGKGGTDGIEDTDGPGGIEGTDGPGGIEGTDGPGGIEGTDGPGGIEGMDCSVLLEMEEMVEREEDDDNHALRPGADNTLSSYIKHKRGEEPWDPSEMWFVLTYTGLTGYSSHQVDSPCWALALAGCTLDLNCSSGKYAFKLITLEGVVHVFQLANEYDYTRWTAILKELLDSDVNKI